MALTSSGGGRGWTRMIDAADGRVPSTARPLRATPTRPPGRSRGARCRCGGDPGDGDPAPDRARAGRARDGARGADEGDAAVKAMEGVLGVAAAAFGVHAGNARTKRLASSPSSAVTPKQRATPSRPSFSTRASAGRGTSRTGSSGLGPLIDNLAVGTTRDRALRAGRTPPPAISPKSLSRALDAPPQEGCKESVPTSPDEVHFPLIQMPDATPDTRGRQEPRVPPTPRGFPGIQGLGF